MSAWSERNGGASPVAGAGGGRQFNDSGVGLGGSLPSAGVYRPTPSSGGAPAPTEDHTPGVVAVNVLDPASVAGQDPISSLMNGLRQALVGGNEETPAGQATRDASLLNKLPIPGAREAGALVADAVGGAGEVAGAGINATGGLLERLPGQAAGQLDAAYNAIPPEFRKQYDDAIAAEKGLFGTGILDNDEHWKSVALRAWAEDQQYKKPSLTPGAFTPPGSLADGVMNLFDTLEVSAAVVAKHWAQLDTPGQEGMDRIDLILAVGDGEVAFNEDKGILQTGFLAGDPTTGLNVMEELVYTKLRNNDWTRDEAADFLASNGQAFGHSVVANIGGAIAADPLNIASFGAGALAKLGASGSVRLARFAAANEKLKTVGVALEEAQAAVRSARVGGSGAQNLSSARKALRAAEAEFKAADDSLKALSEFRSGGSSIRGANVLARAAEGSEKVGAAFRFAGKAYSGLEGTTMGRIAKTTRTLIDPLHALDLHMPGVSKTLDIYSDAIPRSIVETLGVHHYKGVLDDALRMDASRATFDQLTKDVAVAAANMAREGVVDMYRAGQIAGGLGEDLMKTVPDDVFETALQATKQRDMEKWLRFNALKHVAIEVWDDVAHSNLARSLEQTYGVRTADEWLEAFKTMSKEQKSLYKFAVYGNSNRRLLDFVANMAPEAAAKLPVPPARMVLLAPATLTRVGGESLLTKLTNLKTTRARARLIAEWQERYPSLRYVGLDPANLDRSVDQFIQHLEEGLDRLPMQLTADELAALGDEGEALRSTIGDYSLGFRPEDHFLWGLERDSATGLYRVATSAWADHVADGAQAFRPAQALRTNIMGHPIVGIPGVRAATKLVDHMDSAARIMKTQVSGAMVMEAARKRFVSRAVTGELADHGVTERVAQDWFERIMEYTREHQGYSGPRGMGGDELYQAIREKGLIPQPLLNGERALGPDDVMRLVLQAFDGDMRYIGLTQKLSGRAKRYLFEATGSNFAGQIAEHAWPTLKFRYNPIFQLQEKVEPWVLNAQRGVSFATGVKMSEADRLTERLLTRMTDHSLVRQGDLDQYEYSSQVLFGRSMRSVAAKPGTALNRIEQLGRSLTEVQGMKRLNMLRTFRKGLGKELRRSWDEARPGDWEKMKEAADLRAGRILDEDDFALQIVSENAYANDVFVEKVLGKAGTFTQRAEWSNAIKTGAWHAPTSLGELKALDLEHVAASLRLVNAKGEDIKDLSQLRAALATEPDIMDKVVDGLTRLGADPDYIRRVRNGLDFSWGGFWKTAATRFSLADDESRALQDMMAGAAKLRGMNPVDFMSQVFSPSLIDGTEGTLGHLEGTVAILRQARAAGRKIKPKDAKLAESRTRLAGKEGVSTRDDLVRQLSRAFSAHLDPSARRALLLEFDPVLRDAVHSGTVKFDLQEVQNLWDDLAENQLADRILGYMDGKQGTYAYDAVDDAARGVADVRAGADSYLKRRGVTPHGERRYYQLDEPLYEDTAAAYRDLPSTPFEQTGRRPTIQSIRKADTNLKPKPAGMEQRVYDAYQDFVVDTRAQWDHITAPKEKGGMGIKVIIAKGDPYPNSAAMRADVAKGQLRVFAGGADHPLMTNEQNVMFRAVHDIFGHAAEGFEFGPRGELNAAIKHSQMYSDTGRAAMLTETHGQTSYVNYSDDVIPGGTTSSLDEADPFTDYETRFPSVTDDPDFVFEGLGFGFNDTDTAETAFAYMAPGPLGNSIRALPPEVARPTLQRFAELQDMFPDYRLQHLDVLDTFEEPVEYGGLGLDPHTFGATWGGDETEPLIILNPRYYGEEAEDAWQMSDKKWASSKGRDSFMGKPRVSEAGTPWNAMSGPQHTMNHEFGHAVLGRIRFGPGARIFPENKLVNDLIDEFLDSGDLRFLSEYAARHEDEGELVADLFSVAVTKADDLDRFGVHPTIREWGDRLRQSLIDSGHMVDTAPNPLAGKTVREANAAKRGSVYAEQKAGLLPQEVLDRFGEQFVGRGKHVESNPDVARTAQMFGKWTDAVVANGLLKGEHSIYADVLHDVAGLPTGAAVPYNFTEGAAVNLATQAMVRKWDDAFRLQYFAQERSFFERSLNHPMFGMYPASYMWGKIMPEVVRFLATEPFGNKTGGLLYSLMDVQANIALRRDYDPHFDTHMEQLGHSQALSFGGYLLPSLPWDIGAAAPGWMRSIAEQGLSNASKAPGQQKDISLVDPAVDTLKRIAPLTTTVPWAGRAADELLGEDTPQEAAKEAADTGKAIKAAELQPTLQRVMQELQEALR